MRESLHSTLCELESRLLEPATQREREGKAGDRRGIGYYAASVFCRNLICEYRR
ncbi:MAG: hypothetical protein GAK43_00943 [Stenotrophomonas maltophilia]|nr:MAG: hypothetical protein GAK43_00943 [Stenotrophomonas maltophilia]